MGWFLLKTCWGGYGHDLLVEVVHGGLAEVATHPLVMQLSRHGTDKLVLNCGF